MVTHSGGLSKAELAFSAQAAGARRPQVTALDALHSFHVRSEEGWKGDYGSVANSRELALQMEVDKK